MTDLIQAAFAQIDRRSLIERALTLIGAGAAASTFSLPALAATAKGAKPYLSSDAFMLLTSIADTIVPRTSTAGAVDAKVPATLDAMLVNWASGQRRYEISHAILEIDGLAQKAHGVSFGKLTGAQRLELLRKHEETALKLDPAKAATGLKAMMAGPGYMNPGYGKLKELIVLLYYVSEPGLTQELTYVHAPGEWKPSIPVTPETRPAGGGMF